MQSQTLTFTYPMGKDHLGSIRAVVNESNAVVSAQDYDAWGYLYTERQYNASNRYKFTEKERDNETGGYDYAACPVPKVGRARYYDSRIGRWLGVEPLMEKYLSWSPFVYSIDNPLIFTDFNGNDINLLSLRTTSPAGYNQLISDLGHITGLNLFVSNSGTLNYDLSISNDVSGNKFSNTARRILINAINATDVVDIYAIEEVSATSQYENQINLNPSIITQFIYGVHNLDPGTLGWGMVFLHELLHKQPPVGIGLGDIDDLFDITNEGGPVIRLMNQIRKEMGTEWGIRYTHGAFPIGEKYYLPFSMGAFWAFTKGRMPNVTGNEQWIEFK